MAVCGYTCPFLPCICSTSQVTTLNLMCSFFAKRLSILKCSYGSSKAVLFSPVLVNSLLSDFLFRYHSHFSDAKKESSVSQDLREVDGNPSFSVLNSDHFIHYMFPACQRVTRLEDTLASPPMIVRSKALLSTLSKEGFWRFNCFCKSIASYTNFIYSSREVVTSSRSETGCIIVHSTIFCSFGSLGKLLLVYLIQRLGFLF